MLFAISEQCFCRYGWYKESLRDTGGHFRVSGAKAHLGGPFSHLKHRGVDDYLFWLNTWVKTRKLYPGKMPKYLNIFLYDDHSVKSSYVYYKITNLPTNCIQ